MRRCPAYETLTMLSCEECQDPTLNRLRNQKIYGECSNQMFGCVTFFQLVGGHRRTRKKRLHGKLVPSFDVLLADRSIRYVKVWLPARLPALGIPQAGKREGHRDHTFSLPFRTLQLTATAKHLEE